MGIDLGLGLGLGGQALRAGWYVRAACERVGASSCQLLVARSPRKDARNSVTCQRRRRMSCSLLCGKPAKRGWGAFAAKPLKI